MPIFLHRRPRQILSGLALTLAATLGPAAHAASTCHIDTPAPKTAEQLAQEEKTWGRWKPFEEKFVRIDSAASPTPTYHVLSKRPGAQVNADRPVVVFLHGFPEFARSWEKYLHLIGQSHDAIAIDLKGFGESSRPEELAAYDLFRVTREINDVVNCLGYKKVIPVGHDWGGTFAWLYSIFYPLKTQALVVMSTPHPYTFYRELAKPQSEQRQRSHYIELLRKNTPEATAAYRALMQPAEAEMLKPFYDGLRAMRLQQTNMASDWHWERMFSFYRTMDYPPSAWLYPDKPNLLMQFIFKVRAPTLAFYGTADPYFAPQSWQGVEQFVPQLDFRPIEGGGHFINHQVAGMPQQVLSFIDKHAP